jgi:hypothetical protein
MDSFVEIWLLRFIVKLIKLATTHILLVDEKVFSFFDNNAVSAESLKTDHLLNAPLDQMDQSGW